MEGNISFSGTLAGNIEEGGGSGVTPHVTATAAVNDQTGVPGVTVVRSGSDAAPNFDFQFVNLRGADGSPGEPGPRGLTGPAGPEGSQGPRGFTGETGSQGPAGSDGYSPEVTVTDISGGHRVNITDLTHPLGINFDVMDGQNGRDGQDGQTGPQGAQGPAGQGVPTGGTAAQMLVKATNLDYDTEWINNEAVLVDYDNSQSGLQSEDVQGALDELNSNLARKSNLLVRTSFNKNGVAVSAGATSDYDFDVTKSGYTFLGVIAFAINAGGACETVSIFEVSANVVRYRIRNAGTTTVTPSSVYILCLYVANS